MIHIAFYRFVEISDPHSLREELREFCGRHGLKGTILLAHEGINGMLSGPSEAVEPFVLHLEKDFRFSGIRYKRSVSQHQPFGRLLVKVKREILAFREENIAPARKTAPYVKGSDLKRWLDEGQDVILLDTRNAYEVEMGTFRNALNPKIRHFSHIKEYVRGDLQSFKDRKIVTFCTGGIRCEKASAYMMEQGFQNVYQLEGGILQYLAETDGKYWEGRCFVFDERVSLDRNLDQS